MSPTQTREIMGFAEKAWPKECCGFLVGKRRTSEAVVRTVVPADNDAEVDQRRAYRIRAEHWLRTEREAAEAGLEIVGVYHSHPDGLPVPSGHDLAAAWPNLVYLICTSAPRAKPAMQAYLLDEDGFAFVEVPIRDLERKNE